MDINNMELLNDSGLSSLSGFSYQIKVFILRLTQLQQGQRVEFETLDDVAVRSLSSKDSISDSCFKWKVDETSSIEVFQVKQTNVSESVRRQVLYNWLLAYNQKPDISKFTLYVAQGYSINEKAFTNDSEKEYQTIIESDKAVTALVSRVKQIYKDDLTKFKRDYQTICSKSTIERLGDIDELIAEQLITPFHATAADIGKTYFEKRIAELFTRICARIMDRAGQRSPYVCVHAEYMQDVVYELQDENKDTPRLRLIKTKRCEISTLHDEFSRWGTYIFLTQNDLPNKISWKDEDEDANEQ